MKKLSKILILVLSVALVFGAIAMAISAEDGVCYIGETAYGSLAEAAAASVSGDTIVLSSDVTVDTAIALKDGTTLDLGGKKVTNTGADALFVTNGSVSIVNGYVESASELLFQSEDGTLSINGVEGFATLGSDGVTELPDCYVGEVSFVDSNVCVLPLFHVENGDTVTYYANASTFTNFFGVSAAPTYCVKDDDVVILDRDITVTGKPAGSVNADGFSFTLDVNGHTLNAKGYTLINLVPGASRGNRIDFELKSSAVGGVIRSYKWEQGSAAERVGGSAFIESGCSGKYVKIYGQDAEGNMTLSVYAAALYRSTPTGSTAASGSLTIDGGLYAQSGLSASGFIGAYSQYFNGNWTYSGTNFSFNNATFVQAYYSKQGPAGLNSGLDINDGDTVDGAVTALFYYDMGPDNGSGSNGYANGIAGKEKAVSSRFTLNNCVVIGKTANSSVFASRVKSGEIVYNNCIVSADVAPQANLKTNPSGSNVNFGNRGRAIIGEGTVFSHTSVEIKPLDNTVTDGQIAIGTFAADGYEATAMTENIKSISLDEIKARTGLTSVVERDNAITINRVYVTNSTAGTGSNYGTLNENAGYYYIMEYTAGVQDVLNNYAYAYNTIVTDEDAAFSFKGETAFSESNYKAYMSIMLGNANYTVTKTEDIGEPLFYVERSFGMKAYYYELSDWKSLITSYKTYPLFDSNNPLDSWLVSEDKIVLLDDIVYDGKVSDAELGMITCTLDLNGHTIDTSKSAATFLAVGSSGAGNQNGNHNDAINLTILSSVAGGKIINHPGYIMFDVVGANKKITINGHDAEGNDTLTIETSRLFSFRGNASAGSTTAGSGSALTVNGGSYVVNGSTDYTFIEHKVTDAKDGSRYNYGNITLNDAKIVNNGTSWIARIWYSSSLAQNTAKMGGSITINNCDITNTKSSAEVALADSPTGSIVIKDTRITGGGGIGLTLADKKTNGGQIIISGNCEFNGFKPESISAYDANKVGKPDQHGIYFGAAGLGVAKTVGELKYNVTTEATKLVTWTLGETVISDSYLADADVSADYPAAPTIYNNDIIQQSFEWVTVSENNYLGKLTTAYANTNLSVSTTLYTNLAINVYLSEAYAKNYVGELEFAPSNEEGIWVASIALNGNEAFTAVVDSLSFATEDGFAATLRLNNPINLYNYVGTIISDEDMTDAERDLMWYMVDYLKTAYKVMALSAEEIAALGAETEEAAKAEADAKFAALLALYEKNVDYSANDEAYAGETLGIDVAVDLTSAPRFVFTLNGAASISVNGVALEVVDGEAIYEIGNAYNFDRTLSVTTDLGTGSVSLANYYAKALAADTEESFVAETVEALYKYVLAAQAYKASLN